MKAKKHLSLMIPLWWPKLPGDWSAWLPSRGSVLFTVLAVGAVLFAQQAGALPLRAPMLSGDSTTTISYQGRLADSGGNPITTSGVGMQFRLYNTDTGGSPLWEESHTAVPVEDGLFHVLLGSTNPIPVSLLANNSTLWLGITVGSDSEMRPLEQIASVPYAMIASTVPDGSIDGEKLGASFGSNAGALLNCVVRGVSPTPDLELNDGTDWTDWDVSSIVGDTAVAVVVYARTADDAEGSYAAFREPGGPEGPGQLVIMASALHDGVYKGYNQYTIPCAGNQTIQYRVQDRGTAPIVVQFWIVGWYEPANR